jgi:hypothetical protein
MTSVLGACRSAAPPRASPAPVSAARAAPDHDPSTPGRFYVPRDYGSDAQFNPVSVILNHGFDQLRTSRRHDITAYPFGASIGAVTRSVLRPDRSLRHYGYSTWLTHELLPLSLKRSGGGQWYPNYTLHLFANGVTYVRLEDWFAAHGVEDHARLAAGVSSFAFHLLGEAVENGPTADRGVDALTDLLVFDPASILLWNQSWMRRWFSGRLEARDWYGQLSVGIPGKTVENAYSMVVVRAPIPGTSNWRMLVSHGYVFLVGFSRRTVGDDWLSVGAGADAPVTPVIDSTTGRKTALLEANTGVFYDRNGSLLASLVTRGGSDNGLTLNVYPGVLRFGPVRPSFWLQQNRGGGVRFGLSSKLGIGVSTQRGIR